MKQTLSISAFFPAYNEEETISQSVLEMQNVLSAITETYEIIVVDDGSSDTTGALIRKLSERDNRIRLVSHEKNRGHGAAVWSGIKASIYEYIFYTDADQQFDVRELPLLLEHIETHDVVLGYRAERRDHPLRLLNAKAWNILNRMLFGLSVKDIDCAFKVFKRDVVQNLPIKSGGAMMFAELLIRLKREGRTFKEVPVRHFPRTKGNATGARIAVILKAFRELFFMYTGDLGRETTSFQVIKFAIIGVINTTIDLSLYILLTRTIGASASHIVLTKIASFFAASLFSFVANRRFTFEKKNPVTLHELIRFYSVIACGIAINASALYFLTRFFGLYDIVAVLIATLLTFLWGFLLSKFWVFGKDGAPASLLKKVS